MDGNDPLSVSDFCNLNKMIKQITIRSGAVMGKEEGQPGLSRVLRCATRSEGGREYAKPYIEEEERSLLRGHKSDVLDLPGASQRHLCEMEDLTSLGSVPNLQDVESPESLQVYDNYDFSPRATKLSIERERDHIVKMIETNQVVIILGSTGCGKTTQVPQFILDHHAQIRKRCNIIVTQPRRIAASSVARRVCHERGWQLSTIVGYQIGLDNQTSPDTRLTYCTTGVLREKLVRERNMMAYTHVIIDEVHERDIETDFLMLVVRQLLRTNSRTVKVILMSATIDPSHFANYYSLPIGDRLYPAPILEIEKKTNFKVDEFYIGHLKTLGNIPIFEFEEPQIQEATLELAIRLIIYLDNIDPEECKVKNEKPSVLVFLPGIHEIETMYDRLNQKVNEDGRKYDWHLIPLHSSISKTEQMNVFKNPAPGFRKIILSTNIAESSITVSDVVYVIDFCLTKHLVCDQVTNFTSLRYAWAAHSNCKQRAGRAGRLRRGRVYRMVPKNFYEDKLATEADPEMIRCPLTQTVLKAKLLKMGEPKAILARALDPPDLTRLETTILLLKEAGALLMTSEGKHTKFDGDITFLGSVMSHLPLDIQLTKLIMLGNLFSILEDTIAIAAWMSVRNVFKNDFHDRMGPYASKISFTGGSSSDCIAYLHVYHTYKEKLRTNYFKTSKGDERGWCQRQFLNYNAMKEANELVDELRKRLKNLGVYEMAVEGNAKWQDADLSTIRKVVIAGAFYPNYFVRSALGGQVDEHTAVKALAGKDPYTTVFVKGMPPNLPGKLYAKHFKDIFDRHAGPVSNVSFDGSSKVYIEFERKQDSNFPGKISSPVYCAIKMRQLKIPIEIPTLSVEESEKRMKKLGLDDDRYLSLGKVDASQKSRHPGLTVPVIKFVPAHLEDPNTFWIHRVEDLAELATVQNKLNTPGNTFSLSRNPEVGGIYAAPYPQNSRDLYRVQVTSVKNLAAGTVSVLFIDYGNSNLFMPTKLVFDLGPSIEDLGSPTVIPPFALPCTLTGIGPSSLKNDNGTWCKSSTQKLLKYFTGAPMIGEVFSVVDGRCSLTVKIDGEDKSVNDIMVQDGLAVKVEEDYRSKLDNSYRTNASDCRTSCSSNGHTLQFPQIEINEVPCSRKIEKYVEPPSRRECKNMTRMRGPLSSLEMSVYGCTRVAVGKEISTDLDSVNAVLLDSYPEDPHERLLVAGFVGTNSSGSKIKLGQTTLMPNMHGLSSLMCLIFAPTVELRLSKDKRKYIGALCGLGYDKKTGESYFPENEMEMTFDCVFDIQDMMKVNVLRFWMSKPLASVEGEDICDATPAAILKSQQKIHETLFELLNRHRPSQEVETFRNMYGWKKYDDEDLLVPDCDDERAVYQPHCALALKDFAL